MVPGHQGWSLWFYIWFRSFCNSIEDDMTRDAALYNSDIAWASRCLKSSATQMFVRLFVQAVNNETLHTTGHLWPESNDDRWISLTKGKKMKKAFSCHIWYSSHPPPTATPGSKWNMGAKWNTGCFKKACLAWFYFHVHLISVIGQFDFMHRNQICNRPRFEYHTKTRFHPLD